MGIKHTTPKVDGEYGYASEWNAAHTIENDTIQPAHVDETGTYTAVTLTATTSIIAPTVGPANNKQHTLPNVASDTVALLAATQTLAAKTLTAPSIGTSLHPSGDATVPAGTSSLRYTTFAASVGFRVFAASGDANPTVSVESGMLKLGLGGAIALSLGLVRITDLYVGIRDAANSGYRGLCCSVVALNGDTAIARATLGTLAVPNLRSAGATKIGIQVNNDTLTVGSLGSIICPVKTTADAPSDADGGNLDGAIVINSNESKIYVRVGAAWKSVAVA